MNPESPTMRNVLVIAYYFPPLGLSGVQRTLKFVKYLPQFGWQPTVLTVTPTGYYAQDYTLLDELHPHHVNVVRAGSLDPNRLFRKKGVVKMPSERWRRILSFISDIFFIPDNKIGWKRRAVKEVKKLFQKENFDVIFATAPPFTDFLIGLELHLKFGKPLVIDYRDPWHEYPYKSYPTPFHKLWNYKLEKKVLRNSARILATNRRTKELLVKRYKFLDYSDVTIFPQGFDPADFADDSKLRIEKGNRMRLTHAGVFYGERTPRYILEALKKIFSEQPEMRQHIEMYFIGILQDEYIEMIQKLGLEGNVTVTGYVDHKHCIEYLKSSDVLWLMLDNDVQSPGKLYEYLGLRKPILACISNGFIRQTLQESGGAIIIDPTSVQQAAAAIVQLYDLHRQGKLPKPSEEVVEKYNRITLTNELSKIFGFLAE
jgi:glycosyltransferase involved in cell wall biosynthesis